jgi:hypothetical protein
MFWCPLVSPFSVYSVFAAFHPVVFVLARLDSG